MKKKNKKKEEITNPFYGIPFMEALKLIFKAGKPIKVKKKKDKGK